MTESEVIERFCKLATLVGGVHFNHRSAHDCFCVRPADGQMGFQFEAVVLEFIEAAVKEKMGVDVTAVPTL